MKGVRHELHPIKCRSQESMASDSWMERAREACFPQVSLPQVSLSPASLSLSLKFLSLPRILLFSHHPFAPTLNSLLNKFLPPPESLPLDSVPFLKTLPSLFHRKFLCREKFSEERKLVAFILSFPFFRVVRFAN